MNFMDQTTKIHSSNTVEYFMGEEHVGKIYGFSHLKFVELLRVSLKLIIKLMAYNRCLVLVDYPWFLAVPETVFYATTMKVLLDDEN